MTGLEAVTLLATVIVCLGWYLSYTAARLHRLQTRVEGALAALDAQLVRRADAAVEVANAHLVDPATALILAGAASEALDAAAEDLTQLDWSEAGLAEREAVESALTEALDHALDSVRQAGAGPLDDAVRRLADAHRRVQLARRFYNDAVRDVLRLRRKGVVRLFRLAGHATVPRTVEFEDDICVPPR